MSKMTLMDRSIFDRDFMDQFFSPIKYRTFSGERVEGRGTKDDPYIIHRQKIVDKVYHGWYDEDGSYHEILINDLSKGIDGAINKQEE